MKKRKIGYCSNCFYVYRKHQASTNAAYSISQKVFEKFYKHYHMILTGNECIPYIQNLLLNTLRWRLTDHKLWPDTHVDEHHKNVEDLKELLKYIDVSVIAQYPNMNIFHKYEGYIFVSVFCLYETDSETPL
ncbi:MAG: hypothetical protein PUF50_04250 [Erysipelotrichaceae bacterium]|nr:hypothetical protein [Erysipelotrichaceae bacterium]